MKLAAVLCLFTTILVVPCHSAFAEDSAPDAAQQAQIKALVEQLGSDDTAKREEATEELTKIGYKAAEALDAAVHSNNVEVAGRAQQILDKVLGGLTLEEFNRAKEVVTKLRTVKHVYSIKGTGFDDVYNELSHYMPGAKPLVEELLDDENPLTQCAVCQILAKYGNEKVLEKIDNFLKTYEPFANARGLEQKDLWKRDMLHGAIRALQYFPREKATAVAEKYLRRPYANNGILYAGNWTKKHYDAFVAMAKDGLLNEYEVKDYFKKLNDKGIVPFLKDQIKGGKQVNDALELFVSLAPDDPDMKELCIKASDNDNSCAAAVAALARIDKDSAAKIIREKIGAFVANAEKAKEAPSSAPRMLYTLAEIEGARSVDVLESAALTKQLHENALETMRQLPREIRLQALERIMEKWQGDKKVALTMLAEAKTPEMAEYFIPSDFGASQRPYTENDLRMVIDFDVKDPIGYLVRKLPAVDASFTQLQMLSIIASTKKKDLLAQVDPAFKGFEERHREFLIHSPQHMFQQPAPDEAAAQRRIAALDGEVARDMFRLAWYLNMLGKDNEVELRDNLIKNNFSMPRIATAEIKDGKIVETELDARKILVQVIQNDPEGIARAKLKELVSGILKREYLFDRTAEKPKDAPSLIDSNWLELLLVLADLGDRDELNSAKELLLKHAAHPSYMAFAAANTIAKQDPKTVAKFLIACLKANESVNPVSDEAWRNACNLVHMVTNKTVSYPTPLTEEAKRRMTKSLVKELEEIENEK